MKAQAAERHAAGKFEINGGVLSRAAFFAGRAIRF